MKESINVWGIQEYEGDGESCPIVPANLPWYKKVALTFFRFGICPMCITMSFTYRVAHVLGLKKLMAKLSDSTNRPAEFSSHG